MGFTLQTTTAAQGLRWVRLGFTELFKHPLAYSSLFVMFLLAALLVTAVPVLGGLALMMGVPLLSLAYMLAANAAQRGHRPDLGAFLAPWRSPDKAMRGRLLTLCLLYAGLTWLSLLVADALDGGNLDKLLAAYTDSDTTPEQLLQLSQAPGVLAGALTRLGLTALLGVPFWHAPALVFWAGQSPAQALFSSALALWRSRSAFLVYGLGWVGVMAVAGIVLQVLGLLLGGGSAAGLLVMPLALLVTTAYYVSLFFTFRDCFGTPGSATGPSAKPPAPQA